MPINMEGSGFENKNNMSVICQMFLDAAEVLAKREAEEQLRASEEPEILKTRTSSSAPKRKLCEEESAPANNIQMLLDADELVKLLEAEELRQTPEGSQLSKTGSSSSTRKKRLREAEGNGSETTSDDITIGHRVGARHPKRVKYTYPISRGRATLAGMETDATSADIPASVPSGNMSGQRKRPAVATKSRATPVISNLNADHNLICTVETCQKRFASRTNLNRHVRRVHIQERRFMCPVEDCKKRCFSGWDLSRHINSVHAEKKKFGCKFCGREFSRNYDKNNHEKKHGH